MADGHRSAFSRQDHALDAVAETAPKYLMADMRCKHEIWERDTASDADGLCPICLFEDNQKLRKELDYAYRCVSSGYNQGVFDFSVLKGRALKWVRDADG